MKGQTLKTMKYAPFWEVIYFQAYERFNHRDCQLTVLKHTSRFVMNLLNCKKLAANKLQPTFRHSFLLN